MMREYLLGYQRLNCSSCLQQMLHEIWLQDLLVREAADGGCQMHVWTVAFGYSRMNGCY
jgi:hypothetical protein